MGDKRFQDIVETVSQVIDAAGVLVLVGGILLATIAYAARAADRAGRDDAFKSYRRGIGRSILLSLEFLVAADIIRTVAIEPTFRGVGVLAIVVAIRTFLSVSLETEIDGRPP